MAAEDDDDMDMSMLDEVHGVYIELIDASIDELADTMLE
jgi:hypothetical protein